MKKYLALLIPWVAMGCHHGSDARSKAPAPTALVRVPMPATQPAGAGVDPSSVTRTHAPGDVYVVLDVLRMTMPQGGISNNEEFWKNIDEEHVDSANHDLLLRNGIRYGLGSASDEDWKKKFLPILDQAGALSQLGSVDPQHAASLELPVRTGVEYQDLFYVNETGTLYGRTYQHCDNLFVFAFAPVPNAPWDTRLSVSALVRDLRYQFVVTERNQATEVERKRPDYLYDLKLSIIVPNNHFLVIAPSRREDLPCNLGGTFLTQQGGAQPMETVLVLVPKTHQLGQQVSAKTK
jgi:hypothetical protein